MNKKDIQKVFKKYIEHSNREDEVYHLHAAHLKINAAALHKL